MYQNIIKYINNNKDNVLIDIIKKQINLFTENNTIDLLEKIIEKNPHINILNLNIDIFNGIYINEYGVEFLSDNYNTIKTVYLDYGIRDNYIKEKILLLNKYNVPFENLNKHILLSENITLEFINKNYDMIKNYLNCWNILNNIENINVNIFNNIFDKNTFEYKIFNFGNNKFDNFNYKNYFELLNFNKKVLINMINLIDKNYFIKNSNFESYINLYIKNYNLLNELQIDNINNNIKFLFNLYINDENIKIENLKQLLDIKNIKNNYYKNKIIEENDMKNIKDYITKNYYNLDYCEFHEKIKRFSKVKDYFTEEELELFNIINKILNINTKEEAVNYCDTYNDIYNYINIIEKRYNTICKDKLVKSLTVIKNNSKIIELKGEDFMFLIHKIKGFGNKQVAQILNDDPSIWNKCDNKYSYISGTLISNDYFSMVDGNGYVVGINNISSDMILDMGPKDINYQTKNIKTDTLTKNSKILLPHDLIQESTYLYNEVDIIGMINNERVVPNFVFSKDTISKKDKEISKYFNITNVLLHRYIYAELLNQKINYYIEKEDFYNYYNYKLKLALSIIDNEELVLKYFNNLNDDTHKMFKIINNSNYELSNKNEFLELILKADYRIDRLMNFYNISHKEYDHLNNKKILKLD